MSIVHGKTSRFHRCAYRIKAAPLEAESRPAAEPYVGPVDAAEMAAQLAADPEFVQWQAEERAADLGALTRRAMR